MAWCNSPLVISAHRRDRSRGRRGTIVVLAAFLMIAMLGMFAFALDLGLLLVARTELQRTADSAALAAAWQLVRGSDSTPSEFEERARNVAVLYAARNAVLNASPEVDYNAHNAADGDVQLGTVDDLADPDSAFYTGYPASYNAVRIRVRRTDESNGKVPFYFSRVFGLDGTAAEATATAVVVTRVAGFRPPANGENLPILPMAIHLDAWNEAMSGLTTDNWTYASEGSLESGSDGIPELVLYPESNGSSGNFGSLDIGPAINSTSDLRRQIREGISETDLNHHGGELRLDSRGELHLNGNPGLSAGFKDALEGVTGQARIIPVYSNVSGSGNNGTYTIVKFVGARIMDVRFTGREKFVIVQPASIVVRGTIPAAHDGTSDYIYSPAYLFH